MYCIGNTDIYCIMQLPHEVLVATQTGQLRLLTLAPPLHQAAVNKDPAFIGDPTSVY